MFFKGVRFGSSEILVGFLMLSDGSVHGGHRKFEQVAITEYRKLTG
jgi:hypothetical protein